MKDMSPRALFDAARGHYLHAISQALHRAVRIGYLFAVLLAAFMLLLIDRYRYHVAPCHRVYRIDSRTTVATPKNGFSPTSAP